MMLLVDVPVEGQAETTTRLGPKYAWPPSGLAGPSGESAICESRPVVNRRRVGASFFGVGSEDAPVGCDTDRPSPPLDTPV